MSARVAPAASLVAVLRQRAADHPERALYTFLADGELDGGTLTYGEVDRRARAVAADLLARGLSGQRALLLYPPGLDFIVGFLGCLYAGVVAVPAYPPRSRRSLPRLQSIGEDARPAAALTDAATLAQVERMTGELPAPGPDRWLATDTVDLALADAWCDPGLGRDHLAFLQYTSGSTAAPKGVMVSHGNLLENEAVIQRSFGVTAASVIVGWLPLYHDMGLIGNVLQPLFAGARCVMMSPVAFLQRPARWLEAISRYRGTTSGGPNFSYDLCVEKIREEERAALDLTSWEVAFNGAEPVRAESLERFALAFAPQGFRRQAFFPCYGLAEATLFVSGRRPGEGAHVERYDVDALGSGRAEPKADGRSLTGSGRVAADAFQLAIVEPETLQPVAAGTVGEILISGPSIAGGYFGRPEATAETFGVRPAGAPADGPTYLRTGDLGFLDASGELFIAGRQKDLIIIRGRNFYPQDLELTAELAHPALRRGCAAAFAYDHAGAERLVVAVEIDRRREAEAAVAAEEVRRAVAQEHEVQPWDVLIVRAGSIPKTSSGKIQRRRCRQAWQQGELELIEESSTPTVVGPALVPETVVAVASPAELARLPVAERSRQVLAFLRAGAARAAGLAPEHLDPREPVTAAGLDSLAAVELKHRVETALGVELGLAAILDGATLEDLTREVLAGLEQQSAAPAAEFAGPPLPAGLVPLSAGQQALYFLHRLAPQSPAYNVAGGARLLGKLDVEALRRTLQALSDRHELLRARIGSHLGQPVLVVPERQDVSFEILDAATWTEDTLATRMAGNAGRPFDLEHGPVFRATVYHRTAEDHFVELSFHHLVADLWSVALIAREIDQLYPAAVAGTALETVLPPVRGRFEVAVRHQQALLAGPEGDRLLEYWRERLAGAPPHLEWTTDRPRPPVRRLLGSSRSRWLASRLSEELTALARARGGTLFMAVTAGLQALLARYTGQNDILIGSPTTGRAGRGSAAQADVVGYFVNPIVLRGDLSEDPTVEEMFRRTRDSVLGAFAHQDYPFAMLAEKLAQGHDSSRGGLVDVLLVFQKSPLGDTPAVAQFSLGRAGTEMSLGDLAWQSVDLPIQGSQFDLSLYLAEDRGGLGVTAQYDSDLFLPETIDRLLGHLETVLGAFAGDPSQRLSNLPLLTAVERVQVLTEWAPGEGRAISADALGVSMHGHFEAQVGRTPDRQALVVGHDRWTYAELDRAAQHLAGRLRGLGVGPEVTVGVFAHRTADLVVALLAVLKAGGAYVPLDPAYPEDRVATMAEDSGMAVLLTQASLAGKVPASVPHVLEIDGVAARRHEVAPRFDSGVQPENLAYLIYTSGSTGRPKGVAIGHRSAAALFDWSHQVFDDAVLTGMLASTSVCFDLSIFELFVPLARGGRVILADNALALPELPARHEVTLINTVPSAIAGLVKAGGLPASAHTVCLAGEPLRGQLVLAVYATGTVDRVVNLYGPSEDTTYSTIAECPAGTEREPTIGRPLAGSWGYVVDRAFEPVPRGVPGELLLGGLGLSRGYLGRPGLTAERYVPDPFAGRRGPGQPGDRLYRTGDLVRFLADGELEFLGRLDHQVKVRGFRIELGEIETTLARHPDVAEAVLAVFGEGADKALVAYVTPKPGRPAPVVADLRSYLGSRLPAYMVPTAWVDLADMPRTPNGKINRRALPAPSLDRPDLGREYVAPETPVEEMLAEIWTEVLGVPKIGIHDSFFELGGHSLKATQLLLRVRETFGVDLPVQRLFETPTLHHLARVVEEVLLEGVEES
jgi:amino acid adenylation domain-containing protein